MVRLGHVVIVVGFCALPAFGQLDPGSCSLAGLLCNPQGVRCTASDGKSGDCVQRRNGCECVPHNICHLNSSPRAYSPIRVSGKSITTHLRHGDCSIDDGVNCTIDRCDPSLGCVHSSDNGRCNDNNACTADSCTLTGCVRRAINCDDSNVCTSDSCNLSSGCVYGPADGTPCDDGNALTCDDTCQNGSCQGASCNDPPVDADESVTLSEDEIIAGPVFLSKLDNASDPDGDDLDIQSLDSVTVSAIIGGADVSADFSLAIAGNVVTLKHLGISVATFTVNFETGSESIASSDDAYWDSLAAGDSVQVRVNYTVTDGAATDGSQQTITINGVNDSPTDPNEDFTFTEDQVIGGAALEPAGTLLVGAFDPEGDALTISQIQSVTINSQPGDTSLTVVATADPFVYTIMNGVISVATLTIGADGSESFTSTDAAFWNSLSAGEAVVVGVNYQVSDGHGGSDTSSLTLTINGVNDAPNCSVDPEGDDVDIQSLDSATVTATIDGLDVSADFSAEITGNVIALKYLGNPVANFTFDFETGDVTFVSLDEAFWDSFDDGDSVVVQIDYTITDGTATAACSTQITINGANDPPSDANEEFALDEDEAAAGPLFLGNKLVNAVDPDGDVLFMLSIDAVTPDTSGVIDISALPNLTVTLADGTFNDGDGAEFAISTDAGTASLLIDSNGNETMTDPNNIFNPLQGSDVLRIMVDYTISDDGGLTDSSRQTITINGVCDPSCGDGVCGCGEDAASCPSDCSCAALDACGGTAPGGCFCDCGCIGRADCCPDAESACNLSQICCDNGIVLKTDLQSSVGAGGPQTAYYLYVNGQFGSLENFDDWVLSITASNGGSTALVNPSTLGMGVSNNLFEKSSTLNEVFHFEFDDEHASSVGGTTPNLVDTAVIQVAGLDAGEQIQYLAQYTDGTQSSIITTTSAELSATGTFDINAPVGKYLDSIDLSAGPSTTVVRITALTAEICIQGEGEVVFIPDAELCIFPWSLFSYQEDAPDDLKVLATLDADAIERQFLKFQINAHDLVYNLDFNNDGAVDGGGEVALFHSYTPLLGFPVIIDVLIAEALSSGDALYDVSNIKPAAQGNGVFDPADPINTYFFLAELVDDSTGVAGNIAPLYLIGTSGDNDPLNGNNQTDVLLGIGGNDSSAGNNCEDYVNGGNGDDNLAGSAGNDLLFGGSGNDSMDGSGDNDVLLGGTGADALSGSGQGDVLYGGIDADGDLLTGGAGVADLFVLAVTTDASGLLVLLSNNDVMTDFVVTADSLGFLDYSPSGILASDDTNLDFILDSLSALSSHVVVTTGNFSGNASTDTKLTFDGGGSLIFESVNNVSVLDDLLSAGLIQVLSAL